jgi:hypothetical protein
LHPQQISFLNIEMLNGRGVSLLTQESQLHGSGSTVEVGKMDRLADISAIGTLSGLDTKKLPSFSLFTKPRRRLKNNLYNRFEVNN